MSRGCFLQAIIS